MTVFTIFTTWQRGRALVTRRRAREEGSLRTFIDEIHKRRPPLIRVPGTAVFLHHRTTTTPLAMRANVEQNHILHEHVVILSIETRHVPHVAEADRLAIDDLGDSDDGITHVGARFGYMDRPNVPSVMRLAVAAGLECPLDEASYFLSTIDLQIGAGAGMSRWRKHLFLATSRITADAAEYFGLPRHRTVIMGSRIEVYDRGNATSSSRRVSAAGSPATVTAPAAIASAGRELTVQQQVQVLVARRDDGVGALGRAGGDRQARALGVDGEAARRSGAAPTSPAGRSGGSRRGRRASRRRASASGMRSREAGGPCSSCPSGRAPSGSVRARGRTSVSS